MAPVLAEDAKLYYSTETYEAVPGTPGTYWTEITNVMDLDLNTEQTAVDVTRRSSGGFREYLQGLIDASVDFKMLYDTGDAAFEVLQTAFFAKTAVEIAVMDGSITTTGSEGLRAQMMVESFSRSEPIGDALTVSVTLKPVSNSDAAPAWYEVPV